jgi:tetratricopeptide (TPR) repeat protein
MRTKKMLAAFLAVTALSLAQPKVKSKGEGEALMAIQSEQDPAAKIAKVDAFITKYADTQFKAWAYGQAADAADRMKDGGPKVIIYSELAIESDPKAYNSMLMVSAELARSTRENDLDKDEKLAKAVKYAKQAMEIIPTVANPNPSKVTDDQWDEVKKEFTANAHRNLGMVASVQKKYDVEIAEFKQATEIPHDPDPANYVRLAAAYNDNKQPDEALAVLAKITNPQLKPFVDKEAKRSQDLKAAKK